MKAQIKQALLICWVVINSFGCQPNGVCEDSIFLTTDLVQELIDQGGFEEEFTGDGAVHSYTFVLSEDKILCGIGYRSVKDVDYQIELRNQHDSILFSEIMQFKHRKMEYKSVGNIFLNSKDTFLITRKANSGISTKSDLIGTIIISDDSPSPIIFPVEHGPLKIIDVNFDSIASAKFAIPLIDLEVKH